MLGLSWLTISSRRLLLLLSGMLLLAAGRQACAETESVDALTQQAVAALRKGEAAQALALADRAVKAAPENPRGWLVRARIHDAQKDYGQAITDYSGALKLDPKLGDAWQRRGEDNFRTGKISESIADFDAYLKLEPSEKPYHWQRGISLYYAGRFAEGKQQFELHQTVNSQDVENAVWHFLCTARAEGLESARKKLIPISADSRVPMAQVHLLFSGKGTVADVLAAAKAAPDNTGAGEPLFYAHLYLGLYYEATGDTAHAKAEILQAAGRADQNGYMGDVARVHAERLRKAATTSKP